MDADRCWVPPRANRRSWPRGSRPSGLSAIAETLLGWLEAQGGTSTSTNEEIGRACLMAPRTVRKAIAELEAAGRAHRTRTDNGRTLAVGPERSSVTRVA